MKSLFAISLNLIFCFASLAQTIPSERLVDWSKAGYLGTPPTFTQIIDFAQAGGVADGTTTNDSIFAAVISSITDSAVIYFPPGQYFFEKPLVLKNNLILRGAGNEETELIFDLLQERNMIQIYGRKESSLSPFAVDAVKGSYTLEVHDGSLFTAGDYVQLADNDSAVITSSWAYGSSGQIVQIEAIANNTLTLSTALRRDYYITNNPTARKITPIQNVGIESLKLNRLDATAQQTSNIQFNYAANCWVKCIESNNTNYAHVELSNSTHITVSGSYFHHAHAYGGGGKGYGVMLQYTTGDCLVHDNIFDNLRHSMILQAGANGNVLAYNYSDHPYWTETFLPANSAGDLVLHGNYPYANLFEGNTVQHIVIDNSHGINGPYNTIFRNRANLYGFFMNNSPASNNQTIVGNEITNGGVLMGNYVVSGTGHFEYGNNQRDNILPNATNVLPENSLYLDSLPSYYTAQRMVPPIGIPNAINSYIIEAELRYNNAEFTQCTPSVWQPIPEDTMVIEEPVDSNTIEEPTDTLVATAIAETETLQAQLFPNPASGSFTVSFPNTVEGASVALYDLTGKLVLQQHVSGAKAPVSIANLQSGLYLYQVQYQGQMQRGKLMVK